MAPAAAVWEFLVLFELCSVLGKSALDIDLDSGFISNGGDSLGAVALASACKSHGLNLPRDKILKSQSLRGIISEISYLASDKPAQVKGYLLSQLALDEAGLSNGSPTSPSATPSTGHDTVPTSAWPSSGTNTSYPESVVTSKDEPAHTPDAAPSTPGSGPLTEMQLLFISGSLRQPGTNVIVHSETYKTEDMPALKAAWRQVVESEPIFNQDFPRHPAIDANPTPFIWIEDSAAADAAQDDQADTSSIASFFRVTPLDCPSGPALSKLTWTVHHALIDGFSASVLLDKVLQIANGEPRPPPGPSFSQFVRELDLFRGSNREAGDAYWAGKQDDLGNAQHELLLPPPPGADDRYAGSSTVSIDITDMAEQIQATAKRVGITPAALFNAAWALTLAKYTDSDLVSFGAVLWGRSLPVAGALHIVGPLLNTLPLVVRIDRGKTAEQFLRSTFHELVDLEDYQWTTAENGFGRRFDTALSVQVELPDRASRAIRPLRRETRQEHEVPLGIRVDPRSRVSLDYHVGRFSRENVERLAATYRRALSLLQEEGAERGRAVGDVLGRLLPESQVDRLLRGFGNCSASTLTPSIKEDLVTLFERRAREQPDQVAAEKGCERMTYGEMDRVASRVALRLARHVAPGEVVCVYADRSILWLCAMFGVLKAGGVYCALDPAVPQEVRDRNFGLSGATTFVAAAPCQLNMAPAGCAVAIAVQSLLADEEEEEGKQKKKKGGLEHRRTPRPESPAYVCFTSGSTGTPKGVVCTHGGLVAFQSSLEVRLFAAPGRKIAHLMSVAFDGSIHEIFSALTYGATLVLPSGSDPFAHLRAVDAAVLTPSLARVLDPAEFEKLKWVRDVSLLLLCSATTDVCMSSNTVACQVYLIGEPVPQATCDRWGSVKQLYNMYGPTEGTCGATTKRLLPRQPVTIGAANATMRVYILNSDRTLTPPGAVGELYLAGVQVARGYLHLAEQTRERFLPDTVWPGGAGEMMYKTGDRGYWTEDGEVCLLGRRDREIKLRGYRLDMGDLEIRIARACPALQAVAVAVTPRGDQLVAMVQPRDVDVPALRDELRKTLPHYAMPHVVVAVDALPVTPAGKIDYKAVVAEATRSPPPGAAAGGRGAEDVVRARKEQEEPDDRLATPTELAVAKAYRTALGLPDDAEITASSSFVDLGGHSLRQLELLRCLAATFSVRLPLRTLMACPTVRALAREIASRVGAAASATAPGAHGGGSGSSPAALSEERATPIEAEWMTKYQTAAAGSSSFNVCVSSVFDARVVDRARLVDAWNAVLARHPLLSCLYVRRGAAGVVRVDPGRRVRVQTPCSFDLWTEANRPFDLEAEQPVRVFVTDDRLTLVMSHIVADYTAVSILMREAADVYTGKLSLASSPPPPPPPSYSSAAQLWHEPPAQESLDFWARNLAGRPANPAPFGPEPGRQDYSGTSALSLFDGATAARVLRLTASGQATLQQLTLAGLALSIDAASATATDVVLGVPHINRPSAADLATVGLFLEPLPVRITHPPASPQDASILDTVKRASQRALAHAIPWHQLLRHVGVREPAYPNHPLFEVMATAHDFRGGGNGSSSLSMDIPGMQPTLTWSEGAKFKLLCEVTALPGSGSGSGSAGGSRGGRLLMRLEYDDRVVPAEEVRRLQRTVPVAMGMLAGGAGHDEVKRTVLALREEESVEGVGDGRCWFGKRLHEI